MCTLVATGKHSNLDEVPVVLFLLSLTRARFSSLVTYSCTILIPGGGKTLESVTSISRAEIPNR